MFNCSKHWMHIFINPVPLHTLVAVAVAVAVVLVVVGLEISRNDNFGCRHAESLGMMATRRGLTRNNTRRCRPSFLSIRTHYTHPQVIIPGEKSFYETGMPDASCDVVVSQDALLHAATEGHRILGEASRVLKPGGKMVFSDIVQSEEAKAEDLKEVGVGRI